MRFANVADVLQAWSGHFSPKVFQGQQLEKLTWEALDETDKWHRRHCVLQAPLVVAGVLAMTIFRPLSIVNAFARIFDAVRGTTDVPLKPVTDEAIYHARERLGPEPLAHLARALGKRGSRKRSFLGLVPYAIDGVTLSVPDTPENESRFGRPKNGRGNSGFLAIAGLALLSVDDRKIRDCVWGHHKRSETSAAREVLHHLGRHDVVFLDRHYSSFDFWLTLMDQATNFVHRLSSRFKAHRKKKLGPGDWLVDLHYLVPEPNSRNLKRKSWRAERRVLRVIEYTVGGQTSRLITNLLDHKKYPALDIARGYHLRWDVEMAYDECETHLATVCHGTQHTVFRSKTPEGVEQEAWALVAAFNLLRGVMVEAADLHDVPPVEISFVDTLEIVRMVLPRLESATPQLRRRLYRRMLEDIASTRIRRPRRHRICPRVVKQKIGKFPRKRSHHRSEERHFQLKLKLVDTQKGVA
jgi:hypothetical protein